MLDEDAILKNINKGAFFEGLGLAPNADRMTIDTTGARLSGSHPSLAGTISRITQVLIDPAKKEIYEIACEFRDDVTRELLERFGPDFSDAAPNYRERAWICCQQLLRCDFQMADVKIGPQGAESMRQIGLEWAVEMVQNDCIPVWKTDRSIPYFSITLSQNNCPKCNDRRWIDCMMCQGTGKQPSAENTAEPMILVEDDSLLALVEETASIDCSACQGLGGSPYDCQDEYEFWILPDTPAGSVLQGQGKNTGKTGFIILDRLVFSRRPFMQLNLFYRLQQIGLDITLDEARSFIPWIWIILGFIMIVLGFVIGIMFGKLLLGLIVGCIEAFGMFVSLHYQMQRVQAGQPISRYISAGILFTLLIAGLVPGLIFGTWQIGLLIGVIMAGLILALFIVTNWIAQKQGMT